MARGRAEGDHPKGSVKYQQLPSASSLSVEAPEEVGATAGSADAKKGTLQLMLSFATQVYLPSILVFGCSGMVLPVLPDYAREVFFANDAYSGAVMSCLSLAGVLLDIPMASFLSSYGADLTGIFSGAMLVLSGIAAALAPTIWVLGVSRFLHGCAHTSWLTSRTFIFSSKLYESNRGRLISLLGGIQRVSNFFMPLLGSFVSLRAGYTSAFVLVSVFGALVVPFQLAHYLRRKHGAKGEEKGSQGGEEEEVEVVGQGTLLLEIFKDNWPELMLTGGPCLVLNMLRQARDFLFALAGLDAGFDQLHVGQIIATMYLSDFICFPVSGIMIDRLGRKYSLVSSLSLISLGCLLLAFTSGSKVLIFLFASMAGAGSGVGAGIAMCYAGDLANLAVKRCNRTRHADESKGEKRVKALYLGLFRCGQDFGQMVGPLFVGILAKTESLKLSALGIGLIGLSAAFFAAAYAKETRAKG